MSRNILRGDVYYANLNPVIGSEQGGYRPVLIIQNDMGNKHSPTVIVAAITSKSKAKADFPTHCYVNSCYGMECNSIILLEQIRTIDKQRLGDYVDSLDEAVMQRVNQALAISLNLQVNDLN